MRSRNVYVDRGDYMEIHVKYKDKTIIGLIDKEDYGKRAKYMPFSQEALEQGLLIIGKEVG